MLFEYMKQTQRFVRDANQRFVNPDNLASYINRARREVAERTQCIRVVPPISGAILTLTVVTGGSGYTNPTLTISPPDFPSNKAVNPNGAQATGAAQQISGVLTNASVTYGGDGYFQPTVEVNDPTGNGAVVTAQTVPLNVLNPFQEEYAFADFPVSAMPGIKSVLSVRTVSSLFSNLRYTWLYKSFTEYQAFIRTYTKQYYYTPAVWSQFGQGAAGTFLCYPIPAQTYQFEPDCLCIPSDLTSDQDFEAIPEPWQDAVPYMAAHLAYLELQSPNMARMYLDLYDNFVGRYSRYARVQRTPNVYGRRY